jgi:CHAT domain-containing protein
VKSANDDHLLQDELLNKLATCDSETSRRQFFDGHPDLVQTETVKRIAEVVVRRIRVDTREALRLSDAAIELAGLLGDEKSRAFGMRAKANALYANGEYKPAIEHHDGALQIFEAQEEWNEAGRTLSASLQPLLLLGEYDRAFASAERAREIFTRLNLPWRLARLEINVGNIFHRQDRFEEALSHYERAYDGLLAHHDAEGLAVVLSNIATCLITMNDFPRALATYERARKVSGENGMSLLVAQADYNIAYLYYLRGDYTRAIEMLYAARRACEENGDAYHHALCYLDLSEIYLELNLGDEAREMAIEGFRRFEKLQMPYEMAKTLANEAIALGQQGKSVQALEQFARARKIFERENNLVWPWLLDLYQGLLLLREGRYLESRRLCAASTNFFDQSVLTGKAILGHLLLARIAMILGEFDLAKEETDKSLGKLAGMQSPVLVHETYSLVGQLARASGDSVAAYNAFQEARNALEAVRNRLHGQELKISFAKNRVQVYEALVDLCLEGTPRENATEEAFGYMESAKSRSLIETVLPSSQTASAGESAQSGLVRHIRDLREELNWYYHRIELEQLRPEERSKERIIELRDQARAREGELLRAAREMPASDREAAAPGEASQFSLPKLQSSLDEDACLLEYFSAGERILAVVVTKHEIEIVPVTISSRIASYLDLLRFQLSKFRLGTDYAQRFAESLLRATQSHLRSLHAELIAPIRSMLTGTKLVIVPHGPLHYLPFHALLDGDQYLGDQFAISYAPSAAMYVACQTKPANTNSGSLILGIPDERAPQILYEVETVAAVLPQPELLTGDQADSAAFREKSGNSRVVHIATHGIYRRDNPMFSGIKLGDGYLNLYDLYQMKMSASLVTLSGCATGMNVIAEGDELLGLQRGLFCAGAASLLLSLWDVHDHSTAELMKGFYTRYIRTGKLTASLQGAMKALRAEYPHPYFWAPFFLAGRSY